VALERLPGIFKDKEHYGRMLIEELNQNHKSDLAVQVMKKLKVSKEEYPEVQKKLLESAAIAMPRWIDDFTWEVLEEIFEEYPHAIAACIRTLVGKKKEYKEQLPGVPILLFSLLPSASESRKLSSF
jgi:hypothetical protein